MTLLRDLRVFRGPFPMERGRLRGDNRRMDSLIDQLGVAGSVPALVAATVVVVAFLAVATGVAARAALFVEERRHAPRPGRDPERAA